MPELSSSTYSETDGSNNQTAPNGMPEGMAPSGVNDAWRAAWERSSAPMTAITPGPGASSAEPQRDHADLCHCAAKLCARREITRSRRARSNSGRPPSISMRSRQERIPALAGGAVACAGGEIQSGDLVEIEFDGTQFQIMGRRRTPEYSPRHAHGDDDHVGGGFNQASVVAIASAATTDILNAASNYVTISGTTTITGLGSNNGAGAPSSSRVR